MIWHTVVCSSTFFNVFNLANLQNYLCAVVAQNAVHNVQFTVVKDSQLWSIIVDIFIELNRRQLDANNRHTYMNNDKYKLSTTPNSLKRNTKLKQSNTDLYKDRFGIRCVGGVIIPCWPVAPCHNWVYHNRNKCQNRENGLFVCLWWLKYYFWASTNLHYIEDGIRWLGGVGTIIVVYS